MWIKKGLSVILLLTGLTTSAISSKSSKCPPKEDIYPCKCYGHFKDIDVTCLGTEVSEKAENLKEIFQKSLSGKRIGEFEFSRVVIDTVPSELFKGLNIKILSFFNCNITSFADEDGGPAFVGLEDSLEEFEITKSLHYSGSKLPGTLAHLRKLKEIRVGNNYIPVVGNGAFGKDSGSVRTIRLVENNIKELGDQAFSLATNLKELTLVGNDLETIPRSVFPNPADNLQELYLDDNGLKYLPEDFFTNMPLLSYLDLHGNGIVKLDERTWKPVWSQLRAVSIENNPLDCGTSIEWTFNARGPKYLYGKCASPDDVKGRELRKLIEMRKEDDDDDDD